VQKLKKHSKFVIAIIFSSNNSLLVSALYNRIVRLWNLIMGQKVQKLEAIRYIRTFSLTNDKKILLTNCKTIDIKKKSISVLAPKSLIN